MCDGGWPLTDPVAEAGFSTEKVWVNGATTVVMDTADACANLTGVAAETTMDVAVEPVPTMTTSDRVPVSIWM